MPKWKAKSPGRSSGGRTTSQIADANATTVVSTISHRFSPSTPSL